MAKIVKLFGNWCIVVDGALVLTGYTLGDCQEYCMERGMKFQIV